ncbi:MAG: tRNA preQ1(34) S-adenosylmethionine ribosyltransferase-isomerase QueA [Clostridiaceae bacterium]|nr:tRNA preQ1(34) S-adenosylmethionine ribosyltransferase-isomerase QueA [Clostridiaceae bacterium]
MKKSDFHYDLPAHLIAQHPASRRDGSRLLCLDGEDGAIRHLRFSDFPDQLIPGDCLVLNNTRVIPARLIGHRADTGTEVEILLLERRDVHHWETIVRPGRRVRPGHHIVFLPGELEADILEILPDGGRVVRFGFDLPWEALLERAGAVPLPPYIHETLEDRERYQTVYARYAGSAAAPTAGLHFTDEMLRDIRGRGIQVAELTLHVGLGTFRPVQEENLTDHVMHREYYEMSESCANLINQTRRSGGRVVAVGTTSCRVIETVADAQGMVHAGSGWTEIFIYPGYRFKGIDALLTNFHLPESTLIMLVSAFAGRDHVMTAYKEAVDQVYRFFSFGDAMFLSRRAQQSSGKGETR